MKRITLFFAFLAPLLASGEDRTINFESPAFEIGQTSAGAVWTSSFTFQIGSFGSFTPTASNLNDWSTNFQSIGSTTWDADLGYFSGSAILSSNAGAFATSSSAYIWGFNTKTAGAGAEWILLSNTAWTFPDTSVFSTPVSYYTTTAGTNAILGSISVPSEGASPYLISAQAVPEPATYAAVLGLMALGVVGYRRYRQK